MAICKSRNGESGNGMRGIWGIGVGMWGIWVEMQEMGMKMQGMEVRGWESGWECEECEKQGENARNLGGNVGNQG